MAKFNVVLAVQYEVESGGIADAYHQAVNMFARSQSKCEVEDMAKRFDGVTVVRMEEISIHG